MTIKFMKMDLLEETLYKIKNNLFSEREKIEAIFKLGDTQEKNAIPYLLSMLKDKNNSIFVRNSAAMSLGELSANEAVPIIMEVIKSPEHIHNNGALIFSLQNLDCREHFMYFINLLCIGDFEVRQMSEFIIEKYADQITPAEKIDALGILKRYKKQYELDIDVDERINRIAFIEGAQKMLKSHREE